MRRSPSDISKLGKKKCLFPDEESPASTMAKKFVSKNTKRHLPRLGSPRSRSRDKEERAIVDLGGDPRDREGRQELTRGTLMSRLSLQATAVQSLWGPLGVRKLGSCPSLVEIGWVVVMARHFQPPHERVEPTFTAKARPEPKNRREMTSMGTPPTGSATVSIQNRSLLSSGNLCHYPIPGQLDEPLQDLF